MLGRFFSSPTKDNRRVDIVIAVTPRVLRAPAVTPRDEEMRPSGTLQAPTTGSLEAMLRETEREEQIAAARRIPKDVTVRLPDAAVTYEPATKADVSSTNVPANKVDTSTTAAANVTAQNNAAANTAAPVVTTQTADANRTAAVTPPADTGVPQPKTNVAAVSQTTAPVQSTDVANAVKSLVSTSTNVATTNLSAKQDAVVTPVPDAPAAKTDATVPGPKPVEVSPSMIELSLGAEQNEIKLGEKHQLALQVKSDAPLGLAVITLRFDPKVLKINSISPGSLFANAKTAPTLTQSIDEHGMVLISLAPASGSAITADGSLLNLEVEGLSTGDSTLAFDLSNVHLVASDGRALVVQIEPVKLTVK